MAGNWLIPNPSQDELGYWGLLDNSRRVSQWPGPSSNRVKGMFRFPHTFGFYPLPSRIFTELRFYLIDPPPFPPSEYETVWWDLDVVAEQEIAFTTDPSPATGRVFKLSIEAFDVLPSTGKPGQQMTQRIDDGPRWYEQVLEYSTDALGSTLNWGWNQFAAEPGVSAFSTTQSPGWNWAQTVPLSMGVADCFTFPSLEPPPEEGFARLNGVDSYVLFNTFFPTMVNGFKMEFDIRPLGAGGQRVVFGFTGVGGFFTGFQSLTRFQWWNQTFNLISGLNDGVWNHVRIEYAWSVPGPVYSIWIDDVFQVTQAGSFQPLPADEIGRRGSTIEGEFDLKNVLAWDNTPASPQPFMDIPLTVDACCVVPLTIKGTTFNMDLVSCP